jgi:hypothetical protein
LRFSDRRWALMIPEHLPRERMVYPVPATCPCCGDSRLRKIGEDVTETLELVPRQWKVIQHVREIAPASCILMATSVTDVRRTPSISEINSCVSGTVSLSARSRLCSSHRQKRASTAGLFVVHAVDAYRAQ